MVCVIDIGKLDIETDPIEVFRNKRKCDSFFLDHYVSSTVHKIKARYVSNVIVKRYVTEMKRKKNLERNFDYCVEKKKCFLDSVWQVAPLRVVYE